MIGQAIAFVICTVVWLLMMIVPKTLFAIFSSGDAQLAEYGAMAMRKSKMFMLFLGFQTFGFDVLFGNRKTKGCNIYFNQQERIIFNSGIVGFFQDFGTEWSFIQFKCFRFLFTYTCINYIHKWNFTIE